MVVDKNQNNFHFISRSASPPLPCLDALLRSAAALLEIALYEFLEVLSLETADYDLAGLL